MPVVGKSRVPQAGHGYAEQAHQHGMTWRGGELG